MRVERVGSLVGDRDAVQAQTEHERADGDAHPPLHGIHEPLVRVHAKGHDDEEDAQEADAVPRAPPHPQPKGARPRVAARQRRDGAEVVSAGDDVDGAHQEAPREGATHGMRMERMIPHPPAAPARVQVPKGRGVERIARGPSDASMSERHRRRDAAVPT